MSVCVCVSGVPETHVRAGGGGEQRQQSSTGDHQVIGQLRDQVHRVDDEDGVVAVVDKVQNVLVGMSVK